MRDFHLPGRSPVFATSGLCATSHPLAAQTAVALLQAGGNAVDAAIGAAMVLNICEPQMTGLGGDAFALIDIPGADGIIALNGSGRAPAGLDAGALRAAGHETVPVRDVAAVTVPGAVDAVCRLSEAHGRLPLTQVLAPAIRYAEDGVPVAPRVAFDWAIAARDGHLMNDAARRGYLTTGGAPAPGTIFRAPAQAEVLRRIAAEGRQGFYEGEVADDLVASLNAMGGQFTPEDFAATEASWGKPVSGHYKGIELVEHPPNGQGATAILMANILAEFDLAALEPFGARRAHLEAEAAKLAYDARNRFLADAAYTTRLDHMLAPETARRLAALVDPGRAKPAAAPLAGAEHRDTVYVAVVDRDLMSVSLIYSIYHSFGSGLASEKFGILFQNRGAGFTLEKGHPNEAGGGKRPMHTIIPAMLRENGRVTMPFGVMGGAYQPNGHVRVLTNIVDYGLNPQAALDAPRSFADAGAMQVERGYPDTVRAGLAAMGHAVTIPEKPLGGAQAIRIDHASGLLTGASDPRKDGVALGY
ncbi:gamma-glutamyltransferase family protein [Sinisalibacter aestuarii]|uniref:Gamma-glutamyltransferase n=1 Tax=Sinisalibacter aestuarii TaxID=2949426 RepID=A0ABQ5LNX4_9RHOB|nr:gamma-glutamyltransferase family protein [Sinisalibacter aestuarii]GKY86649.1 gamma-glutamyltransferase [Sinisalibacter aestuarii]